MVMMKTIFINGNIYIEKDVFKEALVIENGIIVFVGDNESALTYATDQSDMIDLNGKTVVPGFNDSHLHFYMTALALKSVDLFNTTSIEEVIARGKSFLVEHPNHKGLLSGRGWNQDYFITDQRMVLKEDLDQISTDIPIVFSRACGHVVCANSKALTLANITPDLNIEGGTIEVNSKHELTGVLKENAIKQLDVLKESITVEDVVSQLQFVSNVANSCGITSVQTNDFNIGTSDTTIIEEAYRVYAETHPTVRVYHQICFVDIDAFKQRINEGYDQSTNDFNRYGPLKLFTDGSLGARTAYMRKPYHDDSTTVGILTMPQATIDEYVKTAHQHQIQTAIHAIGDGAIDCVLNSFEQVIKDENTLRHGIIHCQITDEALLKRFAKKDIVAYLQPIFLHADMHVVEARVGQALASTSYAFATMDRLGLHVAYGTDAPVEPFDVINCIHCAVNRQDLNYYPKDGYYPNERISVYQAIDHYTVGSAYASFQEHTKGRLLPGYVADCVVLSKNIFKIDSSEIMSVKIDKTMVDGRFVYER
jgi:predicted amidohydrolase YtcJ